MPRSRARPKKHSKATRVKQKPRGKTVQVARAFTNSSALGYDSHKTQFENYKELQLLADSNQIGAVRDTIQGFKPRVKCPQIPSSGPDSTHPLELEVPEAAKTVRYVPAGERQALAALIERHGEDYAAMARDTRLNSHQHTASHLRRRIARMQADDVHDWAVGEVAQRSGNTPPLPRQRRKPTKNPNPAFKKRSRHFN